jgi:hypothetical protein
MASLFKDLGKQANDLLNKGFYEHEKYSFKVDGTLVSPNGVKATPSVQISSDQSYSGSLKLIFPTANGYTATYTQDLKNALKLELTLDSYLRGVFKPTLELSTNSRTLTNALKIKQTVDLATTWGASSVGVTYALATRVPQLNFSHVFARNFNLGIGAFGVETDITRGKDIPVNVVASLISPSLTATIFGYFFVNKPKAARYAVSFYGPLASNPTTSVGAELQYDNDGKATQIAVGTSHKIDLSSTLKTRFNSRGVFGVVYSKRLQDSFTLSVLADVNVREIDNPNSAKFGFKVAL